MSLPTDFPFSKIWRRRRKRTGKYTVWQGEIASLSDEETRTPQQQHTTDTQSHRSGSVKDGGHQFEMKMVAVIGLRGLQRGDSFELFSNRDDAGNFDDIVYTVGGRRYFLQLKHADNPEKKKLTEGDVVELLLKCFKSYCNIKQCDNFRDIPIDNSEFIIYTNKKLMPKLLKHKRQDRNVDIFFKTCENGEIFSFSPDDKNKQIDVYTLLESAVNQSKEFRESCDREIVREFLKKLIIATGQKGQRELDDVIAEEIRKFDVANVDNEDEETELEKFKTRVENWCRDKKEKMTASMFRNWLQEAKTESRSSCVRSLFNSCTKELVRTGIHFSASETSSLQAELSDKRAVHLRSDALTLCSILLLDCLDTSKYIFVTFELLQNNKNMLLHAWLGGHWEWLIVFCDSTVSQTDLTISEIIKYDLSTKRVIILTAYSVPPISNFVSIEHKFNFEQLSDFAQKTVLGKSIEFQGCEVTMRSVLERHGNVQHVLGPELVTDLIKGETTVNIGGRLQENTGYYAPRVLERKVYLHWDVLRTSNAIFAVGGTTEEDLLKIVPLGKTVECVWSEKINIGDFTQDTSSRTFLLSEKDPENAFQAICKKLEGKTLHWVEFKKGDLLWKMSRGDTETLLDYIDTDKTRADKRNIRECMKSGRCEVNEDSIWKMGERIVLVVAEPGMGKSSTTTHVMWHTKVADPTSWVVRINWNYHTRKLRKIDTATFNFDSLVEFLCSAAFHKSKYTDINRILFKQALQNSGNVTVLMDGFDEISPTHADKAAVILSELMKTKVSRVWLTSRPVQKERLERNLSVFSFSMKRLSRASQKEMLRNVWKYKADENEEKLNYFLLSVNQSVYDENFTGCPLYITTIATAYGKEKYLNPEDSQCPEIDLVNMYEVIVDRKLHIYLTEKRKASCVPDDVEWLKESYLKEFEKCALVAILHPSILKSIYKKKIEKIVQPILSRVQAGRDKIGIVMNVVDGKPQFVHPTFGEYFTARWFSRKFKDNGSVLERILFDYTYRVMRDVFDKMLAKDCPLHYAVLQRDKERFETLLEEGSDVSTVDKGGRTVMHIIATRDFTFLDIMNRVKQYEASLDKRDCVLQWTPLQYATKSEKWFIVERLLEGNVDRSGLDMIRQRARDQDYIDPIIIQAATYGHFLLLEFLCSIGVNIHQASSTDFTSPLHAAVQREQLQVTRWLIQHGADCNTRNKDGQTPLFYAVTKGSLDAVRALVEEGGASLDIRDVHGSTAIDWAKGYTSVPMYQYTFLWKYRVKEFKEIVKYLEERIKVSSSV